MKKILLILGCTLLFTGCANTYMPRANKPLVQPTPAGQTDTTYTPPGSPSPNGAAPLVRDVEMNKAAY